MRYYLRKIFEHDVTHEVSVRTDFVRDFFEGKNSFIMFGKTTGEKGNVTINSATDPRFGGDFKNLVKAEASRDLIVDDLILIEKIKSDEYIVEVVKKSDTRYSAVFDMFLGKDRHKDFFVDDEHENTVDENTEFEANLSLNGPAAFGTNIIYYGTPGCGKSTKIDNSLKSINVDNANIIRTTFYQDYTYYDFVGQILPKVTVLEDSNGNEILDQNGNVTKIINYDFTPGPFALALHRASLTTDMVYLIIEEINRGNAPAIFGDMFQLLDRDYKGESVFPIKNVNLQDWLGLDIDSCSVSLPSNLTIYGTMNTSDQNVFTLDTAFKRRWQFEQVANSFCNHPYSNYYIPGTNVSWETFVNCINKTIEDAQLENAASEDKRLGVYFVKSNCLTKVAEEFVHDFSNNSVVNNKGKSFAYKVLEYIWDDVCKYNRSDWFDVDNIKTLEDLVKEFIVNENPLSVFKNIEFV